jgi:uncharacterized protein YcgL (UPF0745 family)
MKLSAVYKSPKKIDTYLYVEKRDDFSRVPKELMKQFGKPLFVMTIPLMKREAIAGISTLKFSQKLQNEGFYLQLPPKVKSLLEEHLKSHSESVRTSKQK